MSYSAFFRWPPLNLCCCQFEGENICSKDLLQTSMCSSELVWKIWSRTAQNWLQPPNDPRPATKMPPISYIWITDSCLPIGPFKLLWRPLFTDMPMSIWRFFRFTKCLSLKRLLLFCQYTISASQPKVFPNMREFSISWLKLKTRSTSLNCKSRLTCRRCLPESRKGFF